VAIVSIIVGPLESVHDEISVTGVVDVRTRIAVRSDVPHDLGLGDQRASVACDAQHRLHGAILSGVAVEFEGPSPHTPPTDKGVM
jgi:hypothetical protein